MTILSRLASIVLLIAIALVTLCPIGFRPETGHPDLERAGAYLLFGVALGVGFPRRPRLSMAFVIAVAAVLEALQLIDPGRHGRLDDMLLKALAGAVGVLLPRILTRLRHRSKAG